MSGIDQGAADHAEGAHQRPDRCGAVFVLVHGAWHGAWCWERVVPRLQAHGADVHTLTLTGLDGRADGGVGSVTLETHIAAVESILVDRSLWNVVLVGHSYGGVVIAGVADRAADRIRKLIFLDAMVFDAGQSLASIVGASAWERRFAAPDGAERRTAVPPPSPADFGVLAEEDVAYLGPRLVRQPIGTFEEPLRLEHPFGNGVPKVYVDCTTLPMPEMNGFKAKVRAQSGWTHEVLGAGHDAMITSPQALTELLWRHA